MYVVYTKTIHRNHAHRRFTFNSGFIQFLIFKIVNYTGPYFQLLKLFIPFKKYNTVGDINFFFKM